MRRLMYSRLVPAALARNWLVSVLCFGAPINWVTEVLLETEDLAFGFPCMSLPANWVPLCRSLAASPDRPDTCTVNCTSVSVFRFPTKGQKGFHSNVGLQIDPHKTEPPAKTRDVRAKAAGTNKDYVDWADKLLEQEPGMRNGSYSRLSY
jgi:hypothetical protein